MTVHIVTCPQCGSRDEYTRPDPPEHTCGHPALACADCRRPVKPETAYWVFGAGSAVADVPLCEACWDWRHENDTDAQ